MKRQGISVSVVFHILHKLQVGVGTACEKYYTSEYILNRPKIVQLSTFIKRQYSKIGTPGPDLLKEQVQPTKKPRCACF